MSPEPVEPVQPTAATVPPKDSVDTEGVPATSTSPGGSAVSSGISHEIRADSIDSSDPKSLLNKTFNDFEILELIGKGGMGVVYKARQKSLDRIVALKMLLAEAFVNPNLRVRFLEEARLAAALSHPNIVTIYQVGQCPVGHYFVMEFLEGESLADIIQKGPLPIKWAQVVLGRIADAVHYAHTRGVIHRDLKPANVMIHSIRGPIVMDFGVAKHLGKPGGSTQFGTIIGTPAYMPPEQAGDDPAEIGPHSDVYSLGAVLYALLTGRAPYGESKALTTILKVVSPEMPPPVRAHRPEVPAELEAICMKCLAKKPADRYPSAKALADELRKLLRPMPAAATIRIDRPRLTLVDAISGKELRVRKPRTVIGRGKDCHLILKAADVSKVHCHILLDTKDIVIEDLGSANGTFVNGLRVDRAHLEDGDQVSIGDHLFNVKLAK